MNQEDCLAEFEAQLGVALPDDYRLFLKTHADRLLETDLVFDVSDGPSGILTYLFTACDLVAMSNAQRLGDPSRGMMCIGSDQMGGYVYMCVRDESFGRIYYRIAYKANDYQEIALSFKGFLGICSPLEDDRDSGAGAG